MLSSSRDAEFWSGYAATYDGHIASREAVALLPRIVARLSQCGTVLDLGCGTGELALELARQVGKVHAIDFSAGMIDVATHKARERQIENVEFSVHDADTLPFADSSSDAVVMANVLHVMEHPDQVLREVVRVLRPRGVLVAPTYCHGQSHRARLISHASALLFGIRVHHRWRDEEVLDLIQRAGFAIEEHEMVRYRMPLVFVVAIKG